MNFSKKAIIAAAGNVAPAESTAWELDNAVLPNYLNVGNQTTIPENMYISPDGINLYTCQSSSTVVYQYVLSTPWRVSTATYTRSFTYGSNPIVSIFFKTDGTRLFLLDNAFNLIDFDLSTAWNISTTSEISSFSSTVDTVPRGMFMSTDGQNLYIVGIGEDRVYQFYLSTAWRFTQSTYLGSFSLSSQDNAPTAVFFKSDGTTMFMIGTGVDRIHEYSLSTAWDISTISFVKSSGTVAESAPTGIFFNPEGTTVYIIGGGLDAIYTYIATTPWDVATLKTKNFYRVAGLETTPTAIHFKSDGSKMYVMGTSGDDINQFNLSTPWDIQTATYEKIFSVATQETIANALFFSPDGTNMYVTGSSGDDVNQYSLSTAWDVGTASYVRVFSVINQESAPTALYFSPDGTRMYVTGTAGDDINQYDLLVPWNVGTAVYVRVSPSGLDALPVGIFFKPDGTRFYLYGYNSDIIWAYNLTTPWDLSTLVYYQQLSLKNLDESIQDIYFKPDGTMLYAIGAVLDAVYAIELN
jgi:hypothetical protein